MQLFVVQDCLQQKPQNYSALFIYKAFKLIKTSGWPYYNYNCTVNLLLDEHRKIISFFIITLIALPFNVPKPKLYSIINGPKIFTLILVVDVSKSRVYLR